MEVSDKETELGVVQVFGEMADGHAPLTVVAGVAIGGAADAAERAVVGDAAETKHDAVTTDGSEVIGREVGAGGLDVGVAEFEEREGFDGRIECDVGGNLHHVDREERLAQFGTGDAEIGDVDGVDDVVAVGEEGALTQADDLATDPKVHGDFGEFETIEAV